MIVRLADLSLEEEEVNVSRDRVPDTTKPEGEVGWNCSKLVFSNNSPAYGCDWLQRWNDCAGQSEKPREPPDPPFPEAIRPLGSAIPRSQPYTSELPVNDLLTNSGNSD